MHEKYQANWQWKIQQLRDIYSTTYLHCKHFSDPFHHRGQNSLQPYSWGNCSLFKLHSRFINPWYNIPRLPLSLQTPESTVFLGDFQRHRILSSSIPPSSPPPDQLGNIMNVASASQSLEQLVEPLDDVNSELSSEQLTLLQPEPSTSAVPLVTR